MLITNMFDDYFRAPVSTRVACLHAGGIRVQARRPFVPDEAVLGIPQRPRVWENNQFVLKIRRTTQPLGILLLTPRKSTISEARQFQI